MNARKLLLTVATASLTLLAASCRDDDSGGGGPGGPATVSELAAQEIAGNTNETAGAIDLNMRLLSVADTDETASPQPVN